MTQELPQREVYQLLRSLPIVLDAEDEREVLEELVEELVDNWWEDLDAAFPPDESGITNPLPGAQRLVAYLDRTEAVDIPNLLDDKYAEMVDAGLAGPPLSPFWMQALALGEREFERTRKDFARLYRRYREEA